MSLVFWCALDPSVGLEEIPWEVVYTDMSAIFYICFPCNNFCNYNPNETMIELIKDPHKLWCCGRQSPSSCHTNTTISNMYDMILTYHICVESFGALSFETSKNLRRTQICTHTQRYEYIDATPPRYWAVYSNIVHGLHDNPLANCQMEGARQLVSWLIYNACECNPNNTLRWSV